MAPWKKASAKAKNNSEIELTQVVKSTEMAPVTSIVKVDEEEDTGPTYFVDEEGRYYCRPSTSDQLATNEATVVSIKNRRKEVTENSNLLVEGHTVTFLQTDGENGEVNFVLVVQDPEETKPVLEIETEQMQKTEGDVNDITIYDFQENESHSEVEDSDKEETAKKGKVKQFSCSSCDYTSPRRYLLFRHIKCHSNDRPHMCTVCERGFKTMASLQNHVNTHSGIKPHVCKYCGSSFTTSGELIRHVRYRHTHEKPHKCTECDYASVEHSKLRRHMRCHTGERPYQCIHCTYASPDSFKLKRHMRTHTGEKPYKCEHCNQCFTQSNSLKAHKLIHDFSAKPVYACELCPTTCGRKTDLRIHIQKLHTSDKPISCRLCGKSFPDRYSHKIHTKTHEGEKCFKCDLCPYASATLRHLKSHRLKHTDEKPFSCELCDSSFRQKQLLRRHQNLYHNPDYIPTPPKEKSYECHECNAQYAHKGNLIRHLALHDPELKHQGKANKAYNKMARQRKNNMTTIRKIEIVEEQEEEEVLQEDEEIQEDMDGATMDMNQGNLMTMSDSDGQQYVVLEVVELEDDMEQHINIVNPDNNVHMLIGDIEETDECETPTQTIRHKSSVMAAPTVKYENELKMCFGFDGESEEDDELPPSYDEK